MAEDFDRNGKAKASPYTTDPADSIGQPESMRNEEQRMRDNQGGSELTNRPDAHPVGAAGETVSAEAEGPPPFDSRDTPLAQGRPDELRGRGIAAPVRSAGPEETTLPEESPLGESEQDVPPDDERGE